MVTLLWGGSGDAFDLWVVGASEGMGCNFQHNMRSSPTLKPTGGTQVLVTERSGVREVWSYPDGLLPRKKVGPMAWPLKLGLARSRLNHLDPIIPNLALLCTHPHCFHTEDQTFIFWLPQFWLMDLILMEPRLGTCSVLAILDKVSPILLVSSSRVKVVTVAWVVCCNNVCRVAIFRREWNWDPSYKSCGIIIGVWGRVKFVKFFGCHHQGTPFLYQAHLFMVVMTGNGGFSCFPSKLLLWAVDHLWVAEIDVVFGDACYVSLETVNDIANFH